MIRAAEVSDCKQYRYSLRRVWEPNKPKVMFVCLNPSTADGVLDDPTIRKCVCFAKAWGYGGLYMGNLFSYRTKSPTELYSVIDPIGPDTDYWLSTLSKDASLIVAAWGNHGSYLDRSEQVRKLFSQLSYIKMNKSGEPAHPLYLPGEHRPVRWVTT